MQLISKEAAIEELQSIANTIKGVGEWERYFEGLKLGYLSAAKVLGRLSTEENRTTAVRQYFRGNRYPEYGECSVCHKPLVETSCRDSDEENTQIFLTSTSTGCYRCLVK